MEATVDEQARYRRILRSKREQLARAHRTTLVHRYFHIWGFAPHHRVVEAALQDEDRVQEIVEMMSKLFRVKAGL